MTNRIKSVLLNPIIRACSSIDGWGAERLDATPETGVEPKILALVDLALRPRKSIPYGGLVSFRNSEPRRNAIFTAIRQML